MENIGRNIFDISLSSTFSALSPWAKETKKNKQIGMHETKKFEQNKGNHQQNEMKREPTE